MMDLRLQAIVFALIFTLHNIEDVLWLPQWMQKSKPDSHGLLSIFNNNLPSKSAYLFAGLGVTTLSYLVTGLFIFFPFNQYLEFTFIGFVGAILINAIVPHILLTVKYRKYFPGVFTAFFLLLPFNTIILINSVNDHLKISEVVLSTLVVGVILIGVLRLLFKVADRLLES